MRTACRATDAIYRTARATQHATSAVTAATRALLPRGPCGVTMAPAELLLTVVLLCSGHVEGVPRRPPRLKYSSGAYEGAGCQETEEIVKSQLLEALAPTDVVPDAISENSYVEFDFLVPVVVLGWSTRGRTGPMTGDPQERSGFVDSYGATYITTTGSMIRLRDPVTHTEEFVSKGNLATPEVGTTVKLPTPIETTSLRLTPLKWSGVPFMEVALTLCTSALQQLELAREARGVSDAENKARNVREDLEIIQSDLTEQGEMEDAMIGNSDEFKARIMKEDADRLSDDLKALDDDLGGQPARVAKDATIQEEIHTQEMTETPKTEEPQDTASTSPIEKETKRLQEDLKNLNSDLADQALRNIENAHKLVDKQLSEPQLLCQQPAMWRYEIYTAPSDTFTASGNSDQAWRAIFGIGYVPYLFPTDTATANQHQHRMLEVHFRNRSRVMGLKVKGAYNVASSANEAPDWGAVSRFSLLYKGHGDEWAYYADSSGTARVFQTGITNMLDAAQPVTFLLPTPVDTDAIAIIPHDWLHKPYLSLDILACYLVSSTVGSNSLVNNAWEADTLPLQKKISTPAKTAMSAHEQFKHMDEDATNNMDEDADNKLLAMVPPKKSKTSSGGASSTGDCNQSLIAQNGRLKRLLFTNMQEAMLYDNEDHYATIAMSEPRKVTALMVASPNKIESQNEAVKIFVIKYRNSQLSPHWTLLTKHSGEIKMFGTKSDDGNPTTINLPTPVVAEELRIIPQKWTGSNPAVYIDILGCVP